MRMVIALIVAFLASATPAAAQIGDDAVSNSYVTPFPENDTYRMQVIGDAYAEGILYGLAETIGAENRIELPKKHRNVAGLVRDAFDEDIKALEEAVGRDGPHITIAMIGAYDRSPLRLPNGKRTPVGSPEWRDVYGQRVDRMMKVLRRKKAAVYWVGLPVVRRPEWNDDVQMMNEIIREKAFLNAVRYIDAYAGFIDDSGNYDNYGPDLTGKQRRMREGDGVLFTIDGNRKLAHFLDRELRRDLTQARSERAITLLGGEADQQKISPKPADAASAGVVGVAKGRDFKTTTTPAARSTATSPATLPSIDNSGDQKADNSRITLRVIGTQGREETISIDILRPAIAGNVMALVARQQSSDKPAQLGDTLADEIQGGVLVLSSISPSGIGTGGRSKPSATQSPYFRVMVKGERLTSRPGRADDFTWPRPDMKEEPRREPAAVPAAVQPRAPKGAALPRT